MHVYIKQETWQFSVLKVMKIPIQKGSTHANVQSCLYNEKSEFTANLENETLVFKVPYSSYQVVGCTAGRGSIQIKKLADK